MALNANHLFEDLGDVKCSIAEKNCSPERVAFLKDLLEFNGYTVVVVPGPPPKTPPPAPVAEGEAAPDPPPPPPEVFTVGVTDLTFNPVNAMFNRQLLTREGVVVMPDFWKQQSEKSREDSWYWSQK